MATATHNCPHGTNIFEKTCTSCEYDHRRYVEAKAAYEPLSRNINGGHPNILGTVIAEEHRYLMNELAVAVAHGIVYTLSDRLCVEQTIFVTSDPHPEHDGRLSCGTVVGAMRTLAIKADEDPLDAVKFWQGRRISLAY